MNTPTLETPRLLLRRFTKDDTDSLYSLLSDREVNTFLPLFPLRSREEAESYLEEQYLRTYLQPEGYRFAICLKAGGGPIGYVHADCGEGRDFGYALKKEYWRQGIAAEAGRAVIGRLREDGVPYLTATHDVKNAASGRVMQKLGMTYQYTYEELWQPKNILVTFRMYQLNLHGRSDRVYRGYWNKYPVHSVEEGL